MRCSYRKKYKVWDLKVKEILVFSVEFELDWKILYVNREPNDSSASFYNIAVRE